MDLTQLDPRFIGVAISGVISVLFCVIFYWATKECERHDASARDTSTEQLSSSSRRVQRRSQLRRAKKKLAKATRTQNTQRQNGTEAETNLCSQGQKNAQPVTTEEQPPSQRETAAISEPVEVEQTISVDSAESNADQEHHDSAQQTAEELLQSLRVNLEATDNAATVEQVRAWLLAVVDANVSWKSVKQKCALVQSACANAKRLKNEIAERQTAFVEYKKQVEMEKSSLTETMKNLRRICEAKTVEANAVTSRMQRMHQKMKEEIELRTSRAMQAEARARQVTQEKVQIEISRAQYKKEAHKHYAEKIECMKKLQVLETKYAMTEKRRSELEDGVAHLHKNLENSAAQKEMVLHQLKELNVYFPYTAVNQDCSDWMSIRQGITTLSESLHRRNNEYGILEQRLNLITQQQQQLAAQMNGDMSSNGPVEMLQCKKCPSATASPASPEVDEATIDENTAANSEQLELHRQLVERIQYLCQKYDRLLDYGSRLAEGGWDAENNCLLGLNDIDVCLDVMSSKVKMLSKEVTDLKKKNEELRIKNYKAMDVIHETEKQYSDWLLDVQLNFDLKARRTVQKFNALVKETFGKTNSKEEDTRILLRSIRKEYDEANEQQNSIIQGLLSRTNGYELLIDRMNTLLLHLETNIRRLASAEAAQAAS